ncbi:MAG: PaaI family thioesterase [Candidatus Zixiibacteriota bacterium]|nr:MAG: PaaI family thioesterase [candidate division Zixibacteria bacterium]
MKEILRYSNCFVCGDQNRHGLKAKFFFDGEEAVSEITAAPEFEGYRGIYHGGIISSLLDEVMIKAILAQGKYVVTVELTVRYLLPVMVGDKITLSGRVVRSKGRVTFTEGEARGSNDRVYATATAKYIEAAPEMRKQLMQSAQ